MDWLQTLAAEFAITVGDVDVWLSIGTAVLFGGVCLLFGTWVARAVGRAAAGEAEKGDRHLLPSVLRENGACPLSPLSQ